ncbi:MAG: 50S ribosomal protein L4 [bacterium]
MAKLSVIKMDRSEAEPFEISDKISEAPFNPFLIKHAVVYQQAKTRAGNHASKTRSMVVGSRRKLFRQKGTGSSRVGDAKAPGRRGGGKAHGPHPRSHAIHLNKKVRKAALRSALGEKIRRQELIVVESLELESHRTRELARLLEQMEASRSLIVVEEVGRNLELAARNLPEVEVISAGQLNVYNLLRAKKALLSRGALTALQERLTG